MSQPPPPDSPRRAWPTRLKLLTALYAAWLLWLAYVAWVNVSSGNQ